MAFKIILACCLLALGAFGKEETAPSNSLLGGRIIGGFDAHWGEFPYQVSVQVEDQNRNLVHACGGSIVGDKWIVTSAQCLVGRQNLNLYVKAGLTRLFNSETTTQISRVEKRIPHPNFPGNPRPYEPNDIALLKLQTPLQMTNFVKPIELPSSLHSLSGDPILTGWGSSRMGEKTPASVLQKVTLPLLDNWRCKSHLEAIYKMQLPISSTNICTGPTTSGWKAACNSDYGGPLVRQTWNKTPVLVGVASWGVEPCAKFSGVSVHTNVAQYVNWIKDVMFWNRKL